MVKRSLFAFLIIALACFRLLRFSDSSMIPQDEVDALQEILTTMGSTYWNFNADTCTIVTVGLTEEPPTGSEGRIDCDCSPQNSSDCHVTRMVIKGYSLPGKLPPQLVKLPNLYFIDFAYNCMNGTIPIEWASTKLSSISVLVNRLTGEIPKELGNLTTLTYMNLEGNELSGAIPPELGKLIHLQTLILSSNELTGGIPTTFAELRNLTDIRINDNNLTSTLPGFIENWSQLTRLEMHASGLEGPIPSNISQLSNLEQLRLSEMQSPTQDFPPLSNMPNLLKLVLRNCNISGEIPPYIWDLRNLQMLDLSFNKLVGEIPTSINAVRLIFIFLTGNMLSGNVPNSILMERTNIDLSYNNFTWQGPQQPACRNDMNLNLNLFQSSSQESGLKGIIPCNDFKCPRYSSCFHVNCGGNDVSIKENGRRVLYEGDGEVVGGTSEFFNNNEKHWGFSSTGDYMDDEDRQNTRYILTLPSSNMSELYRTARGSPISLTYFHYCLENGNYTVNLQFAELQFTNDNSYNSLGKRIFDVYVQEKLIWKDFNIMDETRYAQIPLVKPIFNVSVTNHVLEIRFYWASKGTTRIPDRGAYGPVISAISVFSNSKPCPTDEENKTVPIIIGVSLGALCLVAFILVILWWKGYFKGKSARKDIEGVELQIASFSLKQIKAATNNFNPTNKIGEGGFGPVYKGRLPDGTIIAVKQLSSRSRQGNREFLNEIGMISCLQHPNLVKLHGCCIEGDQLLLVYEYLENNSISNALFGPEKSRINLDWSTRLKICIGIARGLAFLHEESRLKIVHRDIKGTNVLLDRNLNPKISDFGLARLGEEEKTHISTRVAGTIGYMAPEYALWGYLTYKADVYSFGIVALEVVSGKNNSNYVPSDDFVCLLDWACCLHRTGNIMGLVDERLGTDVNRQEAETMVKVALLCTNASPAMRPTMSEVVSMLEGRTNVPDVIPEPSTFSEDLRFKAMRDLQKYRRSQSSSMSQTQHSTTVPTFSASSISIPDQYEIDPESNLVDILGNRHTDISCR